MLVGTYSFCCNLMDKAILPPFKGSTFRGAFGIALKRVVCAVREQMSAPIPLCLCKGF